MRNLICCLAMLALALPTLGQSSILIRNNSWLDMEVSLAESGSHTLDPSEWSLATTRIIPWECDQEVFSVDRGTAAVPTGDSIFIDLRLVADGDTATLKFRLDGVSAGSELDFSAELPGTLDQWWDDGGFHQIQAMLGGRDITVKYRAETDDSNQDRNLLFAIHQTPEFEVAPADASDPNVLNVVNYNVQFLPLSFGGTDNSLRAPLIPSRLDANLDVVVIEEAFDPIPRDQSFIPEMKAQGFIYDSGILNDYFPWNGGVMIFSRWPIEATAEYDFQLCGPNSADCFANKGIMYAKVNKMGKRYHVFGTHMDAGSAAADIEAKELQYAEMRDFIAAQNVPQHEAVVYCGDFNTRPGTALYGNMLDSLHPLLPEYTGYWSSTMSKDTGAIIDHAWADRRSLIPLVATNEIVTLRGIEDDMWEVSDYSDHRTSWGRFTYPDIDFQAFDSTFCTGEEMTLSVSSSYPSTYQWYKDGTALTGETSSDLVLTNLQAGDSGVYHCELGYTTVHGNLSDPVNLLFYPNGPETVNAGITLGNWNLDFDCAVATPEPQKSSVRIFPNPAQDQIWIQLLHAAPQGTWQLADLRGVTIGSGRLNGSMNEVDLRGLTGGTYLLQVKTKEEIIRRRLVVEW